VTKYIFLILIFLGGCESTVGTSSTNIEVTQDTEEETEVSQDDVIDEFTEDEIEVSQTKDDTNDEYSSTEDGTTATIDLAKVPHKKSSIPMLGILISYNNIKVSSSVSAWSAKLFGNNEHELNHYYQEVSNHKFKFEKATESNMVNDDGIVSVFLNKNHPDTNVDSPLFDQRTHPDLRDALIAVDNDIDFSNYDSNADGHITPDELLLTFIVAGYEDSYEGFHVTNGVWGHQSCTENIYTPTLDSVSLMGCSDEGNFAIFGERHNIYNSYDATIGIIAHELGHSAFSLPDLYNTRSYEGGIGFFGLMGAGVWTQQNRRERHGNTPTHFSAWSKVYMGWVTPVEESGLSSLVQTSSDNYNIIKIPISANQYYLLENRDNSGYDKGLYSLDGIFDGGVAIWKIDETKLTNDHFLENDVNNDTANKGVDLVEAQDTGIDIDSDGGERALFYAPVTTAFGTKVTNISIRGSVMNLNIN